MPILREAKRDDVSAIAHVHVEAWRSTYRHLLPADYLDRLSVGERAEQWAHALDGADPARPVIVAEVDGRLLGFASGGPERTGNPDFPGELYAIYLLDAAQRQGTGQRLVRVVAERLQASGMASMLTWALSQNPACRFYEALGGQRIATKIETIGGISLEETAFGWPNLTHFGRGS